MRKKVIKVDAIVINGSIERDGRTYTKGDIIEGVDPEFVRLRPKLLAVHSDKPVQTDAGVLTPKAMPVDKTKAIVVAGVLELDGHKYTKGDIIEKVDEDFVTRRGNMLRHPFVHELAKGKGKAPTRKEQGPDAEEQHEAEDAPEAPAEPQGEQSEANVDDTAEGRPQGLKCRSCGAAINKGELTGKKRKYYKCATCGHRGFFTAKKVREAE